MRRTLACIVGAALLLELGGAGIAVAGVECYERAPYAGYSRTFRRRVQEYPGVYSIERAPPHYGTRTRHVVLQRASVVWHRAPSEYRTVAVTRRVGGGWTWEKRLIKGKWVMCKVRRPYRTVAATRRVLVRRGHAYAVRRPAITTVVQDRVLLRAYRNFARYTPAYTYDVYERAHIQPEGMRWRRFDPRGC